MGVLRVEFTIEPFVEGRPGPHVTAAIDAARAFGGDVAVGPFGSSCDVPADRVGDVLAAVGRQAFDNGATHVNITIARLDTDGHGDGHTDGPDDGYGDGHRAGDQAP